MKVVMVRSSGKPVNLNDITEFEEEFRRRYDAAYTKHEKDMSGMQEALEEVDKELANKYDTLIKIDLPTTGKAWKRIIEEYGSVLTSTHAETGEVMLVIMDMGV